MVLAKTKKKGNGKVTTLSEWLDDFWPTSRFTESEFFQKNTPAVNVKENDENYEIQVAAPGLKKEDFDVNVENDILTIKAESKASEEETEDNYTRREFKYTSFARSFSLPQDADEENVTAVYNDGVLRIEVKRIKTPENSSKKIKIS